MAPKKLYRSRRKAKIGGVCQGIADYFEMDPTVIRLVWAFVAFWWGTGIFAYLIAWLIMPENPDEY